MKNKHRGFTIVELVIVIAVVAVLAAVTITTFSAIVKRANISTDTQIVRNMNVFLTSESAESAPLSQEDVKQLLKENGISDLSAKTKFYNYFWIKNKNVIILADEGDRPVYPEEYLDETRKSDWYVLDALYSIDLPDRQKPDDGRERRTFTVTVTQSGSSVIIPFEGIPAQVTEYSDVTINITLPDEYREGENERRYAIQKVTAIMHDGDKKYKRDVVGNNYVFAYDETAVLRIPDVTGNIEINIDVAEFCFVDIKLLPAEEYYIRRMPFRKGTGGGLQLTDLLKDLRKEGKKILSVEAYRDGVFLCKLDYREDNNVIHIRKELTTDDFEMRLVIEPLE
jgi:prepilin-type N-terminal cleavage/methylation domain-containing protein